MTTGAAAREELTPAEQELLDAILAGRRAEVGGQTIRAEVLRDLSVGSRPEWQVPPVGISLNNAIIDGRLDLEGCAVDKPLIFLHCRFRPAQSDDTAIHLRDARVKRVALYECDVTGAIKADRAHFETAFFLTSSKVTGMVRLRGASVGEALAMDETRIENSGKTAILADGLRLGGPWILRAASVVGEMRLAGARISGGMLWEECRLSSAGVAINADGATCEGPCVLRRANIEGVVRLRGMTVKAFDAQNAQITASAEALNGRGATIESDLTLDGIKISGGVLLSRTRVGGEFSARGAHIAGPAQEWSVAAAGLIVEQGVSMAGAKLIGGMSLAGARIGQGLTLNSIEIDGHGRAIEADVIDVGGNWTMRGAKLKGSIRFAGAQINGQVAFTESHIEGGSDLAIRADGASIRGGWFMGRAQIRGLVRLPAAHLGNEMRLRGSKIEVVGGPALFANGVRIARELVLDGGFETKGGIALDHAEIEGQIDLTGSHIVSAALARGAAPRKGTHDQVLDARYDEAALSLVDARLDRLIMPESASERSRGIVDLSRAHVGSYEDAAAAWPPPLRARKREARGHSTDGRDIDHLVLDGFVYDHLENPAGVPAEQTTRRSDSRAARTRLRWLEAQSGHDLETHFKPQAWLQLSRRLSAQGYHDDAREIAIARRRRHRKGRSTGHGAKLQGWLLDVFALYGFNPWRTIIWMALFVLLFAAVWFWAAQGCAREDCKDEQVFVMALKSNFGQDDTGAVANYPGFSPLPYSFDVFIPFVDFGFKEHWRPRTSYMPLAEVQLPALPGLKQRSVSLTLGSILYTLYVLEMLIGLILTSLAVTGFTGLLKGDDDPR